MVQKLIVYSVPESVELLPPQHDIPRPQVRIVVNEGRNHEVREIAKIAGLQTWPIHGSKAGSTQIIWWVLEQWLAFLFEFHETNNIVKFLRSPSVLKYTGQVSLIFNLLPSTVLKRILLSELSSNILHFLSCLLYLHLSF